MQLTNEEIIKHDKEKVIILKKELEELFPIFEKYKKKLLPISTDILIYKGACSRKLEIEKELHNMYSKIGRLTLK